MQHYDIAILGGGISGLGLAVEASSRGISTLLLEAGRCCQATSNNTLRIIHGGFRYLQHAQIARVIRSLNDQSFVFREYNSAVAELPCLMPLKATGLKSRLPVTLAATMYGLIMKTCRSPLAAPTVLSARETHALAPLLSRYTKHGALCWHDVVMSSPELLAQTLYSKAIAHNTTIREQTSARSVTQQNGEFTITTHSGEEFLASKVVNTLGPWLDTIDAPEQLKGIRPRWCKGFNITIKQQLHPTHAIGIQCSDGRLFFCVPRGSGTAIGTWYVPLESSLDSIARTSQPLDVSESELNQFIASFTKAFPEAEVSRDSILSVDVGVLPMRPNSANGPVLYGNELIHHSHGYCEVISTKYTTFHSQARKILRVLSM